jgi:hypothetical protein
LADRLLKFLGIDVSQFTPLGITRMLIAQMEAGIPAADVARQLAAVPGIHQLLPDDANPEMYWQQLINDPEAKASMHPLDRAALHRYIVDVLTQLKEAKQ